MTGLKHINSQKIFTEENKAREYLKEIESRMNEESSSWRIEIFQENIKGAYRPTYKRILRADDDVNDE